MRTLGLVWALSLAIGTAHAEDGAASRTGSQPGSEPRPEPETLQTAATDTTSQDNPAIDVHDAGDVADGEAGASGCAVEPVVLKRAGFRGPLVLSLTTCDGEPSAAALSALSEFAQPAGERGAATGATDPATSVHALNAGLLERLQRIADHYPGHAIEIVSGYRPNARVGSRHRSGDALDLRLDGVDSAELSAFVRGLAATGVGFYPNSGFVHVDVRTEAFYWVDSSGPAQAARYATALTANAIALDKAAAAGEPVGKLGGGSASQQAAKSAPEPAVSSDAIQAAPEPDVQGDAAVPPPTQAELDAELHGLAERALVVMNAALGHAPSSSSALPTRTEP